MTWKKLVLTGVTLCCSLSFLTACKEEILEEPTAVLPDREHTWVRKETVKKSRNDFLSQKEKSAEAIAINPELKNRLAILPDVSSQAAIKDRKDCLERFLPINRKRVAVQKAGGLWHAYERSDLSRPFSHYGMQLDSQTNKMVFAIRHLCRSAKGLSKTGLDIVLTKNLKTKSHEELKNELIELGEPQEHIDKWLAHRDYIAENEQRDLSYTTILALMKKTETIVGFYEELSKAQVTEASKQAFLSEGATLLETINEMLAQEEYMALAIKEDNMLPDEFLAEM